MIGGKLTFEQPPITTKWFAFPDNKKRKRKATEDLHPPSAHVLHVQYVKDNGVQMITRREVRVSFIIKVLVLCLLIPLYLITILFDCNITFLFMQMLDMYLYESIPKGASYVPYSVQAPVDVGKPTVVQMHVDGRLVQVSISVR